MTNLNVMTRQSVIQTISDMPNNFELEDLVERLVLVEKIEKGRDDVKNNKVYSHEEAKSKLGKWLK